MPAVVRVRSEDNAFQHAEVLKRNRTRRHQSREFFVEGVKPLNRLLQHGWTVNSFWYSAENRLSGWGQQVLAASKAPRHYELPAPLMQKLSDREEPSELVALAAMPPDDLDRIGFSPASVAVVFDRPSSPGNLGTLIRSADALGAAGLLFSGHAVDLYDPQTIRASMGSIFALPVVRVEGPQDVAAWIASQTVRPAVVGTDSVAEASLDEVDLAGPVILIVGNEARGMSYRYRELCDVVARIPMSGSADSINVACATSIALYEVGRQRRRLPDGIGVE